MKKKHKPFEVHLPGFLQENEIGLGDVIKRATSAIGLKYCKSCEQRASIFNNWIVFTGRAN